MVAERLGNASLKSSGSLVEGLGLGVLNVGRMPRMATESPEIPRTNPGDLEQTRTPVSLDKKESAIFGLNASATAMLEISASRADICQAVFIL